MRTFKEFDVCGVLSFGDKRLTWDEFMDEFIDMIEAKGWSYGGGWCALDDDGIPVALAEEDGE